MQRFQHFPLAILLSTVFCFAPVAHAATIDDLARFILVSSFVDTSGVQSDDSAEGTESVDPGAFLESAAGGTGFGDITNASGEAIQDSVVFTIADGGLLVDVGGAAGGVFDANDPGLPSRARVTADTRLSILFTLEEASPYSIAISLSADLDQLGLFAASASVQSEVVAAARSGRLGQYG